MKVIVGIPPVASHFAQYVLFPVLPSGIVVTAVPVSPLFSNQPPKVWPLRVGTGRVTGSCAEV